MLLSMPFRNVPVPPVRRGAALRRRSCLVCPPFGLFRECPVSAYPSRQQSMKAFTSRVMPDVAFPVAFPFRPDEMLPAEAVLKAILSVTPGMKPSALLGEDIRGVFVSLGGVVSLPEPVTSASSGAAPGYAVRT